MNALLLTLALSHGADLGSTTVALKRPNVVEANPLMRSMPAAVALKTGVFTAEALIIRATWKRHRGAAIALAVGTIAANGLITAHNLRQGQ